MLLTASIRVNVFDNVEIITVIFMRNATTKSRISLTGEEERVAQSGESDHQDGPENCE